MSKGKTLYSSELKKKVIEYAKNHTFPETAEKFGLKISTVNYFLKQAAGHYSSNRTKIKKTRQPEVIEIKPEPRSSRCAVVVCNTSDLASVLAELGHGE